MESPRKFNDCYFYYYSTCTKGENCVFRHEPSALGCETMCAAWQEGKCLDKRCKLRHMELRKNRKQIPCYWETQPGGCRKKHCSFMHKNPDARTDGIAPSQPNASTAQVQGVPCVGSEGAEGAAAPGPAVPAPLPLLWHHQRQVVLDSALIGCSVLPPGAEAMGGRRAPHEQPAPYAMPVDPLVVNFEEESDNESAPSLTPTKNPSPDEAQKIARTKSQELLLLEKIQAEAAAFYGYDSMPPNEPSKTKIVRTNLSTKYDRLSLDEISGKNQSTTTERRKSLDFKVLTLDEIRARKKDSVPHPAPITLNLSRKRKLSTTETISTSGNKIIKVVRSNSIVYKKVDHTQLVAPKFDQKATDDVSRKRTYSEQSDNMCDMNEDELIDNIYEFKKIKVNEPPSRPKLVRSNSLGTKDKDFSDVSGRSDYDSDPEVQIVSVEMDKSSVSRVSDEVSEIIDLEVTRIGEPVDVVDLSDDLDDVEGGTSDADRGKNFPDVVASCHVNQSDNSEKDIVSDIDAILNDSS